MQKQITSCVIGIFLTVGVAGSTNAALHSRAGGAMIYDDDFDMTWIRDANYGAGSIYDDGASSTDGLMTWASANLWAANLTYQGLGGWRLPSALNRNGGGLCGGFAICADNEMGHLYYSELGGSWGTSILTSGDPDLALFINIQATTTISQYWTSTLGNGQPWFFQMYGGVQAFIDENNEYAAWAVRSGDVAVPAVSIPDPGTYLLLFIGLAGSAGIVLCRKRLATYFGRLDPFSKV